jgi:pyroglutamyl-peptidase
VNQSILVTAFEPFGGERVNPTIHIAEALQREHPESVITRVLPVMFGECLTRLEQAIDAVRPDVVLALGQAGGRSSIALERVAVNLDDARIPDNAGQTPVDTPVIADAPDAYFTRLPVRQMLDALQQAGIPAQISNSAGAYVCNHLMFGLLHLIQTRHPQMRGGFIHVPFLPEQALRNNAPSMSLALMVQAMNICLEVATDTKTSELV